MTTFDRWTLAFALSILLFLAALDMAHAAPSHAPTICRDRRTAACRNIHNDTRQPPRPYQWRIPNDRR